MFAFTVSLKFLNVVILLSLYLVKIHVVINVKRDYDDFLSALLL